MDFQQIRSRCTVRCRRFQISYIYRYDICEVLIRFHENHSNKMGCILMYISFFGYVEYVYC